MYIFTHIYIYIYIYQCSSSFRDLYICVRACVSVHVCVYGILHMDASELVDPENLNATAQCGHWMQYRGLSMCYGR